MLIFVVILEGKQFMLKFMYSYYEHLLVFTVQLFKPLPNTWRGMHLDSFLCSGSLILKENKRMHYNYIPHPSSNSCH